MVTRSLSDLTLAVMQDLGVIDAMDSPSASDHALVRGRYEALFSNLREESLAYWEEAAIPLVVFQPVTDLVALHCGAAFGRPKVSIAEIEATETSIKRRIRRHTHKLTSGVTMYQDDF